MKSTVRKIVVWTVVLALLLSAVAGCSARVQEYISIEEGQSTSGGDAALGEGVNLKDITVTAQEDDVTFEFSFIHGSRQSDEPEAKIASVPLYEVSVLPAPARVKVDLQIDFWDYTQQSVDAASLLYGIFQSKEAKNDKMSVYLQLDGPVSVSVQEEEAKLLLTLHVRKDEPQEEYFVALDALSEYEQGLLPAELGYMPTLSDDYASVVLISSPLASQGDADELVAQTNQGIAESIPSKKAYSFAMNTDMLPQAKQKEENSAVVSSEPVFEPEEASNTSDLPVLVENGRYLCTAPDGEIFYVRAYLPDTAQDEENVLKEELWLIGSDGTHQKLEMQDFYGVERAAVSPDGNYLAILDTGANDRLLYVYDMQGEELHNLGEEGFGNNTTSFVWDKQGNVIYAMTGYGTLQLTKYDFTLPETERITSIEEKYGAESRVAFANGELYFADASAGEEGMGEVYRVDIETSLRETVAQGIDFALSPDGRYLVTLMLAPGDEESTLYDLVLHDLEGEGGAGVKLAENILMEKGNYAFGVQSNVFYYTTATQEGVSEEYPFAFLKCTIAEGEDGPEFTESFLGYSKTGHFVPGSQAKELYLIDYFMQNNYNFSVTYVFRDK